MLSAGTFMAQRLAGKTALVTGGGTGIGWGIAQALAEEGVKVAIAGRRLPVVQEAASSWKGQPAMLAHEVDVADRVSVKRLFDWAQQELKQIDILVNAAGVNIKTRSMTEMTPEQWDQVMAINSTGVYNCLYSALPDMTKRQDGLIINISSISGKRAAPLGGVAYNASKFAVAGLATSVGNEVSKQGVRITTIFPGEVDTPILEHRPQAVTAEHRATMLLPEDFGPIVVALALLPPRAHVPELVIKPTTGYYV
jgi:NAD(P)-dependent dehydrogenase (short-subunit alcohol dehydrogenase family)